MSSYNELVKSVSAVLKSSTSVLLLCHDSPDGDTLGSAQALRIALQKCGVRCDISAGGEIPQRLAFLAEDAILAPDADSYSLIAAIDTAERKLLGTNEPLADKVGLIIDHHRTGGVFGGGLTLRDSTAAATGELVYDIILALELPIDREIALPLYTAIASDTGCFRFSNTTARTFRIAAVCAETGLDMAALNRPLFELNTKKSLALERELLESAIFAADGAVCVAVLSKAQLAELNASDDDTGGLSGFLRNIEGVEVCAFAKESKDGDGYKISMRSNEWFDVSAVCAEFGGGGHMRAAGCRISGRAEEVQTRLVTRLCEIVAARNNSARS